MMNSLLKRRTRTLVHAAVALLPRGLKVPIYRRLFGFKIAQSASIGISVLDVDRLEMKEGASIGHGNFLTRAECLRLDEHASIGFCNIIRGGRAVELGAYSTVLRFNVLNSIPDNDCIGVTDPRLILDRCSYIVSGHRLDFTDRVLLGRNVVVAGRNSSLWTHNRQSTAPIEIGDFCYIGSEVRIAPGASLGAMTILGMGAVLTGKHEGGKVLGGVPARVLREVTEKDRQILRRKSRNDIPDTLL